MGFKAWFLSLHRKLDLHKKVIPIIVICFSILIVLTIIVTSFIAYYFGLKHGKEVVLKREFELIYDTLIKHGAIIERMEGVPITNYKILRQEFLKKRPDVRIIRSNKIDEVFGKESLEYYPKDKIEENVLLTGNEEIILDLEKKFLRGIYPIKAKSDCLRCHYNIAENEVMGAINIGLPIGYIFEDLKLIVPLYIFLGLGGILTSSILVYLTYIFIAHKPLEKVGNLLNKVSEGDLTVELDKNIKEREDLVGKIAKSTERVLEYMKSFSSKTLDYSIKLVEEVDDIFKLVENVNEKIKFQTLKVAQSSIIADDFGLTIGEISRNISNINYTLKDLKSKIENLKEEEIKDLLPQIFNYIEKISEYTLEIATDIEKGMKTLETINQAFEEINQISSEVSQLIDKINEYTYETLLISSYMKTIASAVKTKKMEDILFDLFEKDIDRYILRLQAHIKGLDRLDPERWGDYKTFPIGKWYYSEEGERFRQVVKDFDFGEFENTYQVLHLIGKELIIAYNMEDSVKVDKLFQQLRTISRRLKLQLEEMREKYMELMEK